MLDDMEEVEIGGDDDKDYSGGGFEDPFGFPDAIIEDDDQDQEEGASGEKAEADTGEKAEQETSGQESQETEDGGEIETPPEPPEDTTFEALSKAQQQIEALQTELYRMQGQMQQMAQSPPMPPAQQQAMAQAKAEADKYGIDMDDLDLPGEEDWAEDPNTAAKKIVAQVNSKIAEKIEAGVSSKILGTIQQQQQVQHAQQQSIQSAVGMYPQAAKDRAVYDTATKIYNAPANAPLKSMPMGPYFALVAAAGLHGMVPVTAAEAANKAGVNMGATSERSRQQRLKQGAMNTGGKEGKSTIKLSPTQLNVAKQMGLSPKAYAEGLKATKGGA